MPPDDQFGSVPDPAAQPADAFGSVPDQSAPELTMGQKIGLMLHADPTGAGDMLPTAIGMGLQSGGAALGGMGGTMAMPGVGTVAGAMAGSMAGNAATQKMNEWLGYQDKFHWGQNIGAGITGLVPGASLIESTIPQVLVAGAKAGIVNAAATNVSSVIDAGHEASIPEQALAFAGGMAGGPLGKYLDTGSGMAGQTARAAPYAARDSTMMEGKALGLVLPISKSTIGDKGTPTELASIVDSWGQKAATNQQATIMNQAVKNRVAAKAIGADPGAALTPEAIQAVQDAAYAPYQKIQEIAKSAAQDLETMKQQWLGSISDPHELAAVSSSPLYKQLSDHLETVSQMDIDGLRDARLNAKGLWQKFSREGGASNQQAAADATAQANVLEDKIGQGAQAIGDPKLMQQFQAARKLLARTHAVENATSEDGEVNSGTLAAMLKSKVPLDGDLRTLAKFHQDFSPYMGLGSKTQAPGVGAMGPVLAIAGGLLAGGESHSAGTGMAVLGSIPASKWLTRQASLSAPVQRGFFSSLSAPEYGAGPQDFGGMLGRFAAMNATQPDAIPSYLAAPSK